jgi:SAM-dependent methyltransferase
MGGSHSTSFEDYSHLTESERRALDARLAARERTWWDGFYADRARPCPFFVDHPDENLVEWISQGCVAAGRALDIGCGHGRNAVYLARHGFIVDAIDYSAAAIAWARERAAAAGVQVGFTQASVFDVPLAHASYDLVYDSGCFHHIAPHRRAQYVDLVARALRPGGFFGLTCFRPEGGSGYTDAQVYERDSLGGGLGYTRERLRELWSTEFDLQLLRQMKPESAGQFGADFLWVMLARKRAP